MYQKQFQENLGALNNIVKQINSLLSSRKKVVQNNVSNIMNVRPQISEQYKSQIISHCNQYSKIKKIVQDFTHNPNLSRSLMNQSSQFWQLNQRIQRELQKRLKNLKQIDLNIDELIEAQIQMAKQIQEIQEKIRGILNRKQQDHISKAQPLNMRKEKSFSKLQDIKKQKELTKEHKLSELNKILQILHQMKHLRKKRLEQCKKNNFTQESVTLFGCLAKDVQHLIQNRQINVVNENSQNRMFMLVNQTSQKVPQPLTQIQRLSKQLTESFQMQIKTFQELNKICRAKSQASYFHQRLLSYFQVNEQELHTMNQKFSRIIQTQNQKSNELNQVLQGITTTQDTIEIFQNLKHNIETQDLRKRQLIDRIARLNKSHATEKQRRQAIIEKQSRIQAIKINYSKLQALLEEAAEQADVKSYKTVHSQIDELSKHVNTQYSDLEKLKTAKRQSAKKIYSQTTNIQEEYRDLISQMFPQIWLRDNDFSKDETIADFDVYLSKLFSRLKILA